MLASYSLISQCPALLGPIRFRRLSAFSFAILRMTVDRFFPVNRAKSSKEICGLDLIKSRICSWRVFAGASGGEIGFTGAFAGASERENGFLGASGFTELREHSVFNAAKQVENLICANSSIGIIKGGQATQAMLRGF